MADMRFDCATASRIKGRHSQNLAKIDENLGFEKDLPENVPKLDPGVILASQVAPQNPSKIDEKSIKKKYETRSRQKNGKMWKMNQK